MKKFLRKKPVMIAFIIAAVVFLAVEIGILVRPVSYGLNYTYKSGDNTVKINIMSDTTARQTIIDGDEKTVLDVWIYRDGNNIKMLDIKKYVEVPEATKAQIEEMNESCTTRDEYKEKVKELKELKEKDDNAYKLAMATAQEFGLFEVSVGDKVARCPQAVAFVVIHGVVTTTLIVFAVLSVVANTKKKNKKK